MTTDIITLIILVPFIAWLTSCLRRLKPYIKNDKAFFLWVGLTLLRGGCFGWVASCVIWAVARMFPEDQVLVVGTALSIALVLAGLTVIKKSKPAVDQMSMTEIIRREIRNRWKHGWPTTILLVDHAIYRELQNELDSNERIVIGGCDSTGCPFIMFDDSKVTLSELPSSVRFTMKDARLYRSNHVDQQRTA